MMATCCGTSSLAASRAWASSRRRMSLPWRAQPACRPRPCSSAPPPRARSSRGAAMPIWWWRTTSSRMSPRSAISPSGSRRWRGRAGSFPSNSRICSAWSMACSSTRSTMSTTPIGRCTRWRRCWRGMACASSMWRGCRRMAARSASCPAQRIAAPPRCSRRSVPRKPRAALPLMGSIRASRRGCAPRSAASAPGCRRRRPKGGASGPMARRRRATPSSTRRA